MKLIRSSVSGAIFASNLLKFSLRRLRANAADRQAYNFQLQWLHELSLATLRSLNVRYYFSGEPPKEGLLISNHLGYVDIPVLASITPCLFVAKKETATWPALGRIVQWSGTIFIDRQKRSDVQRIGEEIGKRIQSGALVGLFPEGTSSDGTQVLPFFPSLLAPAVEENWPVTPASIHYTIAPKDGTPEKTIAYWGDMVFGPHFFNLLAARSVEAHVHFGKTRQANGVHRKTFTRDLRDEIILLRGSVKES